MTISAQQHSFGEVRLHDRQAARPARALLAATALLYGSFGLIYGLMQGGLPPLMRARGIDLAAIGWFFIVLIPFGLTFLWAPLIDLIRPVRRAPRIGWIVLMQAVIVAMLILVARSETAPRPVLLALGLGIAFAAATMDIALDALATICVAPGERTTAAGLKVAALAGGSVIGGGVFVAAADTLGWSVSFYICAVICALATVPILFLREQDADYGPGAARRVAPLAVIRHAEMRRRMALLTLASCTVAALSFLNRVMLVDLHVAIDRIGWIVGAGAPLCGLCASLLAIPALRRLGVQKTMLIFAAICLAAALAMGGGAAAGSATPAMVGAIVMNAGTSGFFVLICATTLGWAQREQPATDYAIFYGASRLVATLLIIVLARIVPAIGWPAFYLGGAAAVILTLVLLGKTLPDVGRGISTTPCRTGNNKKMQSGTDSRKSASFNA